jgi:hypothetical protein
MSRKSYVAALDKVLKPMGFTRKGKVWSRQVGTIVEKVDLQWSQFAGTTVNLWSGDTATDELLREAVPGTEPIVFFSTRLGHLIDGNDRWWKNDPNGPAEVAELIALHAPAFFEGRRSLEDQARWFGRANPRWTRSITGSRIYLALTLYRMGEVEEACRVLTNPPRTAPPSALALAESVRRWLGCPANPATASR